MADYFEAVVAAGADAKQAGNWIMGDLQALLSGAKLDLGGSKVPAENLAAMIALIEDGTISGKMGKEVLAGMFESGRPPRAIIEEKGLVQISDSAELEAIVRGILENNPAQVEEFKGGKQKVLGFFVGQIMKATQGKANPKMVNELLRRMLKS